MNVSLKRLLKHVGMYSKACVLIYGVLFTTLLSAEQFRMQFKEGAHYRVNSTVSEDVYVNAIFSHHANITNRITIDISDVKAAHGNLRSSAQYSCSYMTSEKNGDSYPWTKNYKSIFRRNDLGVYSIASKYFMPTVRNVPVFPEKDVKIGQSWRYKAHEAHDLSHFGLKMPFIVPVMVSYTYDGTVKKNGTVLHRIITEYDLSFDVPKHVRRKNKSKRYPVKTRGKSRQVLLWDNEQGLLPEYSEEFMIAMILNTGDELRFIGKAEAHITETKALDKHDVKKQIDKELKKEGIKNTSVEVEEQGITISLERIQFEADSARLRQSEKIKIAKIARMLKKFPTRDLLISGHTAKAGTKGARKVLSEERAKAVAEYLLELGTRSAEHIYTRGLGAEKPIAPNDTEENRARNRRVEITILEK